LNIHVIMNSVQHFEQLDSFFAYSDEYDWFLYSEEAKTAEQSEQLDDLETADAQRQRTAVCRIVTGLLREVATREQTAEQLLATGTLPLLLNYAKMKVLNARTQTDPDLSLESDLRLICTALFLLLSLSPAAELLAEMDSLNAAFEEVFLALIKLSLEKSFIPMKKVCVLLYKYLSLILPAHPPTEDSHLELTKPLIHRITELEPRYKTAPQTPTEAFYVTTIQRRLMTKENPLPQVLVVGLLRAMLAACPGAPSQPQGLSVNREWQAALLHSKDHKDKYAGMQVQWPCDCEDCTEERHKVESTRHKLLLVHYVTLLLELLVDRFKANHALQLSTLTQQIYDANGVLVMLKFMNQDFAQMPDVPAPALRSLPGGYMKRVIERTLLGMMRICYCIVKPYPERIESNLIQYKAPLIMKRLYSKIEAEAVQLAALKLIKLQVKYQPRKWKTYPANLKFISAIYQRLPPAKTDWLNGPVDKSSVLSQEEVSQLNVEFNYHNYWQIFDRKEPAEEDLSEDFKSHYEDWLQEHVWGYYE